jgi:hypothetical protein
VGQTGSKPVIKGTKDEASATELTFVFGGGRRGRGVCRGYRLLSGWTVLIGPQEG